MAELETPHVFVVAPTGDVTDITETIESIFRKMSGWPADWEEYVGDDVLVSLWTVAKHLEHPRADERLATYIAEVREQAERMQRYREEEERLREKEEQRRARQRAEADVAMNELAKAMPEFLARIKAPGR